MDEHKVLIKLVYLLIHADGEVDEKELLMSKKMMQYEKMDDVRFNNSIKELESSNRKELINSCIEELGQLDHATQIRFIAWTCLIANADGIMDNSEWSLIFNIYHTGLGLDNKLIMNKQQELWLETSKKRSLAA